MSDLKFTCESCGQHLVVETKDAGRKLACPSCRTQLTVPGPGQAAASPARPSTPTGSPVRVTNPATAAGGAPPSIATPTGPKPSTPAQPPAPSTSAAPSAQPVPVPRPVPARPSTPVGPTNPAPAAPPVPPPTPSAVPTPLPATDEAPSGPPSKPGPEAESGAPTPVQIGILTSDVKRDVVAAARALLADPDHWMPGRDAEGHLAYAARKEGAQLHRVEVGSEEATHHSLVGALLLELQRRNVITSARGRTEFLDEELPQTLWRVIHGETDTRKGAKTPDSTDPRLMAASHEQCLKVLDTLEPRYAAMANGGIETVGLAEAAGSTLEDLMLRVSRDEVVTVPELVRSVHRELVEVHRRLAELEKTGHPPQPKA